MLMPVPELSGRDRLRRKTALLTLKSENFTNTAQLLGNGAKGKKKVFKAEHLYSILLDIQTTLKRSGVDHTVLPATNTMPALPHKHSPDGATTD